MGMNSVFHEAVDKAEGIVNETVETLKHPGTLLAKPHTEAGVEDKPSPEICLKDYGHRKIKQISDELHLAIPLLEQAGYVLQGLSIDIGLPPKIVPRFVVAHEIDDETKEKLLEGSRLHPVAHSILKAVLMSTPLRRAIKVGNLSFQELEIHCATVPKVRLLFQ